MLVLRNEGTNNRNPGGSDMDKLFAKLEYAKKAVQSELDSDGCSVDFHDMTYWASEVIRLRKEIKEQL